MSISTLNEICKVDWGNTSLTKKAYADNGKFLGVSAAGMDGRMDFFEHEKGVTVISAIGANCGRVFFPEDRFTAIKNTITLTPKADILYPKYLFYALQNNRIPKRGAGQPFVTKGDTEKYKIFLPLLSEQKRIVEILEKAEALKKKRQEINELSNKINLAMFLEMFGDIQNNFKGICKRKIGEVTDRCQRRDPTKQPKVTFKYVDISGVNGNKGVIGSYKEIIGKDAPSRARQIIYSNDVIISTVRPNLRATALISEFLDNQICSTGFCVLRPTKQINHSYLYIITRLEWFTGILVSKARGASYPAVTDKDILGMEIPVPPIAQQQKFADLVQKIEKIKKKQQESEKELDNLFNSLMQKAFKGGL